MEENKQIYGDGKMKYKLVAYKNEDNKVYYISKSNNLEFFDRYKIRLTTKYRYIKEVENGN